MPHLLHKGPLINCVGCATYGTRCAFCEQPFTTSTALFYDRMFCSITCEGKWLKADAINWDAAAIAAFNFDFAPFVGAVSTKRKV